MMSSICLSVTLLLWRSRSQFPIRSLYLCCGMYHLESVPVKKIVRSTNTYNTNTNTMQICIAPLVASESEALGDSV